MGNSTLPTVPDKLCMVANINTRKLKKAEIKTKRQKFRLFKTIDFLELKINNQARRLDVLSGHFKNV